MKKIILNHLLCFFILSLLLLSLSLNVFADLPKPENKYVNDYAEVLNEADKEGITKLFQDLEQQTGIEASVVTINSISDFSNEDTSIESFATKLFNSWGIGNKKYNNGLMILVSVKDRSCRIELGSGYGSQYNAKMKEVIEIFMIPHFKRGDYSRGTYEGCLVATVKITEKVSWIAFYKWHLLMGVFIFALFLGGISLLVKGKKGWGWVCLVGAGTLLFVLLKFILNSKNNDRDSDNSSSSGGSSSGGGFGGGSSSGGGASGKW